MRKNSIKKIMAAGALLSICTCYTIPVFAYTNEEAVYSKLDNNGKPYKTIVSTVENDGDKNKVSQEEMDKELPIECNVTYKIDGKEMSAEEIAGKSGRVTITLKYINKAENEVYINGNNEKMYTPFLVVSGVILDNEKNTNIEVNHGKVINNGELTIAAGFAVPGLVESLNIGTGIDVCDTIEISMDAKDFELKNIMTYASPKVFSEMDINLSDFNELFNKVSTLQDSSKQIESGAIQLNNGIIILDNGISELQAGSKTLETGAKTLSNGANSLNEGAKTLNSGIEQYNEKSSEFNEAVGTVAAGTNQLNTQYADLDDGINELNSKSGALKDGAEKLNNGISNAKAGVNQINEKVSGAASGLTELAGGVTQINTGAKQISNGLESGKTAIAGAEAQAKSAGEDIDSIIGNLKSKNESLRSAISSLDAEENSDVIETLNNQIEYNETLITKLESTSGKIVTTKQCISSSSEVINGAYTGACGISSGTTEMLGKISSFGEDFSTLTEGLSNLSDGMNTLQDGAGQLYGGTQELTNGTAKLAYGSSRVSEGIGNLSYGTSELYSASNKLNAAGKTIGTGANTLKNGTESLSNGANQLANGAEALANGTDKLSDGSKQLLEGSNTLAEGIKKFNSEGINKICDLVNNDGKNLIRRIEKLEELSKNYNQFASDKEREDIHFFNIMDVISTGKTDKKDK